MRHAARFLGRAGSAQHVCCYVLQTEEMDDSAAADAAASTAEHITSCTIFRERKEL